MRRVIDTGADRRKEAGLRIVLGVGVAILVPVLLMAPSRHGLRPGHDTAVQPVSQASEQAAFCTQEYRPVCGQVTRPDGAVLWRTFPNACFARQAGATAVSRAPCSERVMGGGRQVNWNPRP